MSKIVIITVFILLLIALPFYLIKVFAPVKTGDQNTPVSQTPKPSPSVTAVETVMGDKKLIEVKELKLSFETPKNWKYTINKLYQVNKNYLRGQISIKDATNTHRLTLIPNFTGGWCEGPNLPKLENIPNRFDLPGRKYICSGPDYYIYYIYGDYEGKGAVLPNLFISIWKDETAEIKAILDSIKFNP